MNRTCIVLTLPLAFALAAALAWAKLSPESLSSKTIGWLTESMQEDWSGECLHGLPWDVYADLDEEEIINGLGSGVASAAIQKRVDKILHGKHEDRHFHCYRAIIQAFGGIGWKRGMPLGPDQRHLLTFITTLDDLWKGFSGFAGALASVGLPMGRRELADILGIGVPGVTDVNYDVSMRKRVETRGLKPGQRVFDAEFGPGTVAPKTEHDFGDTINVEFDKEGLHTFFFIAQFYEEE